MSEGQRRHYRVTGEDLNGIVVSMLFGQQRHDVHLLDISAAGAAIAFMGWKPEQFQRISRKNSSPTSIQIEAQSLQEPLDILCQVVHLREVNAGLVCGIAFHQPVGKIVNLDQALLKVFNRRGAVRVEADPDNPIAVTLMDEHGATVGAGMVRDLSLTGVGITVHEETLKIVQGSQSLSVQFHIDGNEIYLRADVRFARKIQATHPNDEQPVNTGILGIEFDVDAREEGMTNRRLADWVMRRQREIQRLKQSAKEQFFEA